MVTKLGRMTPSIICKVVTCPPIHNMMVVTSPIGDHAPPALAARTTMLTKNNRSSLVGMIFRIKATNTIVVVRLSRRAERKKVRKLSNQSSLTLFLVVILSVITLNPSWVSIFSTMVMAPSRKNRISEISPR